MIVDTSAFVAMLLEEPGFERLLQAITSAEPVLMSTASALESAIVIDRRDVVMSHQIDAIRSNLGIRLAPVTERHYDIARRAHNDYGRGSGSKARLNFGDCMSYALAIEQDDELLFIGDDFTHTDVRQVLRT